MTACGARAEDEERIEKGSGKQLRSCKVDSQVAAQLNNIFSDVRGIFSFSLKMINRMR